MATINMHPALAKPKAVNDIQEEPIGDSSFLQKTKYDPSSQQLTVTMKTGAEYVYSGIDPSTFQEFQQSKSKGSFYARVIKGQGDSTRLIDKNVGPSRISSPNGGKISQHQVQGRKNGR